MMDDYDLAAEYYRLRSRVIYLEHVAAARLWDPALIEMADLSRGIVHDLGNGLNVLRARLAAPPRRRGVQAASTRRTMETAGRLCEALGQRIYTLPELSPDAPLRPSPVNLCAWLPDLLETFRAWLGDGPGRPCVEFQANVSRLVVAEYDRKLRLAVWELLLNAEAALNSRTDQGGAQQSPSIRVSVDKTPDGWAQITVQDNGPGGLSEGAGDVLLRALQRPGRAGVGLYVCHKIVEKHRGWLEFAPALDGGSLARIKLPAGNPEPDWDDEGELSLEMETLSDRARVLQAQPDTRPGGAPDSEAARLALAARFGALSATTGDHLEYGLQRLRDELLPLFSGHGHEAAALAAFAFNKLDYLQAVITNLRLLDAQCAPRREPVNMNALVRQAAYQLAWRTQAGRVRVDISPQMGLPPALGDRAWLAAALLNLLRNAIDAAVDAHPGGSGKAWIETMAMADGQVCTRICDNGAGIPHQLQPRVYDFDYTSRSHRHYGLGLYLAHRAIESAGGTMQFEDTASGTKIVIKLLAFGC